MLYKCSCQQGKVEAKLAKGITWKNWVYALAVLHSQKIPTKTLLFLEGKPGRSPAAHTHQYLFLLGVEIVSLRSEMCHWDFHCGEKRGGNCWKLKAGTASGALLLRGSCVIGSGNRGAFEEQSGAGGFPWSSSVSQNLPSERLCKLCF